MDKAILPGDVHNYVIAATKGIRIRYPFSQDEGLKRLMEIVRSYNLVQAPIAGEQGDIIYKSTDEDGFFIDEPNQRLMFAGFTWSEAIKGILFDGMPNITTFTELSFVKAERDAYDYNTKSNTQAAFSH
tara:strand:+ start:3605 stop:3991 length:387 start_codon:yes stop_codon:yes gene_type:complete